MPEEKVILQVKNLKRYFNVGKNQTLKAVDDVSFSIYRGETFGLVGESGCGKSTLGRTIIRLYGATGGSVRFDGADVHGKMSAAQSHELSRRMQMIFQDPYASLNPRMKVMDIIAEGIDAHHLAKSAQERAQMVVDLLEVVGLQEEHANRFPHEFSGGQRQRIGIARALAVNPDFVIADEPISALDVSIQAQVINLLKKLQEERKLTYLFIAHDLSMVKYISDRVGVMYLGSMAELAESRELFDNPLHPYTQALLSAIPLPDPDLEQSRSRVPLQGSIPSPINLPECCHFCSRCPKATEQCRKEAPKMVEVKPGHFVACHLMKSPQA
ncbi:ABC transporter ATP-binding protein [Caproiciproducens galactitolivorans]|uniref:ATP-binding cassette domain-containing protein n=1 Tax=Caproiciproducens galactitolivorans TaxID=642589 RepID=A0ABT4BUS5_9FIRM|nr:oligopeptide/dipeptide ABC transporter ATP-binding protein [Caproiciproducens galactitolivorans]MCY1714649.1 ATP-binding cassette domain-containing protein [Caproiciproducens galactitolivorans]